MYTMVRPTKSDKKSTTAPAATAPATAATPAATATKEAAPKKASTKKPKAAAVEAAPAPAVEAAPAAASDVATNEVVLSEVDVKLNEFSAKLQQGFSVFSTLKGDFKTLEKLVARELKAAQKSSKKTKRSGNRQPSGFVKPTRISDELAAFLGKAPGTEMARTAVSKEINNYIRANKLQDTTNGRKINPDARLSSLLKIESADELTYFNLQRFMKHHFPKSEVANVQVSATA